ncbi:MAG: deoxyribodipyrimidine photo-lyase, partial [Pseudomonadales bacterium]|nr:deoxyribodipyrimidine photo-lyase [Pseudomonadales bacterium]
MTASPLAICWFRQDLRLSDNPALCAAVAHGPVLPVFILDHQNAGSAAPGAASSVWLHHSLESLDASLGGALQCYEGDAMTILGDLIRRHGVTGVFWNRCYEPWQIRRDTNLKRYLREMGCETESFNGSLL